MPNQFSSENYPTTEPAVFTAGDRIAWKRTDLGADYPPASYSLKYSARLEGTGTTEIEITASESGTDYIIEIPAATSAAYAAGRYHWDAYIIRTADSERITLESGIWDVRPNRDTATTDPRSDVRIAYDNAMEVWKNVKLHGSYSIGGRTWTSRDLNEIIAWVDRCKFDLQAEESKEKLRKTGFDDRHTGARFVRI